MEYTLGQTVKTKKIHPCGNKEWVIIRTGADFKLKCTKCNRIIMVSNEEFYKMIKQ